MLPQCSHITRKRGVYYYRRRLPGDGCDEVAVSLRTRNYRQAEARAERLHSVFTEAIRAMNSKAKITVALRECVSEMIAEDESRWLRTPSNRAAYAAMLDDDEDPLDADVEATKVALEGARSDAKRRDFIGVDDAVDALIQDKGLSQANRPEIAFGIVQAKIKMLEARLHRLRGEHSDARAETVAPSPKEAASAAPAVTGPRLSELLPNFLTFMTTKKGWRAQTLHQNSTTYRMFIECCSDLPLQAYGKKELAAFYDLLCKLPALYSKDRQWRGLSLAQIAAKPASENGEPMTMKTVKRHFSALGTLFGYFKKQGAYEGENPAYGFDFPRKGRARDARRMWEGAKLKKLFSSPVWAGCASEHRRSQPGDCVIKDEKYWLPLLGVYHGNRLEEFAQLYREDVKCEDGIWYFQIHDAGDRQIKNEQSKRRVPIHPAILQMGFLGYVEEAAPLPNNRVFPLLRHGGPDRKLGYYFTKWWTEYRKSIGAYERGLDYHSFRHGVTTKLYAALVPDAIIDELTGHEGQGTSRVVYKKEMPLAVLRDAIAKVEWPEFDGGPVRERKMTTETG